MPLIDPPDISDVQHTLVRLIAEGRTDAAIGRHTGYTTEAVKQQAKRLYVKVGARNRAHLVHLAHQWGWLSREPGTNRGSLAQLAVTPSGVHAGSNPSRPR